MKRKGRSSREQRDRRRKRGEDVFVFVPSLTRCLGRVDRDEWEDWSRFHQGDVLRTAAACGLVGVPRGAKALWGRSAEEALGTYRRWNKKRSKGRVKA